MSVLMKGMEMPQEGSWKTVRYDAITEWNEKSNKQTNADRIRSLSDEELAEFMCHNVSNGTVNCAFCAAAEFCRTGHNGWLNWLKEESEGRE